MGAKHYKKYRKGQVNEWVVLTLASGVKKAVLTAVGWLPSDIDEEDVFQECYLEIWKEIRRALKKKKRYSQHWGYVHARSVVIRWVQRHQRNAVKLFDTDRLDQMESQRVSPDSVETADECDQMLGQLTPERRILIESYFGIGRSPMTADQLAKDQKVRPVTIRCQVSAILETLSNGNRSSPKK